jgi:hypothetical protein
MTGLYFIMGYCLLFVGVCLIAVMFRQRGRQDRAPFPENTRLLRGPGESLRRKLTKLDESLDTLLAAGCLLPLLLSGGTVFLINSIFPSSPWLKLMAAALALGLPATYLVKRVLALLDRRRNTALGYFGELAVAEALDPLKATGHRVFHDVPGDGPAGKSFNLDHVVIGPAGVFAIETKTRRKGRARTGFMAHEIIYDGRTLSYPWGEDTFGLDQARRQSEWLAGFLQQQLGRTVPVSALLVFPGWFIIRKGRGPVNVLNPRELPAAIERSPGGHTGLVVPALDPAAIDLIARQLEARCRDVEL